MQDVPMDLGLLLACLSLAVAALSLGWQIAVWTLEGRRVRLTLTHGAMGFHGSVTGKVARDGRPKDLTQVRAEGFSGEEVIGVAVTNLGRAPVRIDKYSVRMVDGGLEASFLGEAIGPDLPFRLPPGETETWYARASSARALVHAQRTLRPHASGRVRMTVQLGTGDVRLTRRHLELKVLAAEGE